MEQPGLSQLLVSFFDSAKALLTSRKHREDREMCEQFSQQVSSVLVSSHYFPVIKRLLANKLTTECSLQYIDQLAKEGFTHDSFIEQICQTVYQKDDKIQYQILKTLFSIFSLGKVHGRALLETFRACYHIHLTSKANSIHAKNALTKMVQFLFAQLEQASIPANSAPIVKKVLTKVIDFVEMHSIKASPLKAVPSVLNPDDPDYLSVVQVEGVGKFGWCIECRSPADFYCIRLRDPVCSEACKLKNYNQATSQEQGDSPFVNDALMIFRSICKLSLKDLSMNTSTLTYKSKLLSLELILAVMSDPGPKFIGHSEVIEIIRHSLCESLLKNCLSSERQIFMLSISIFTDLVYYFKDSLRSEIGVFMNEIFIKLLESSSVDYYHKQRVIEVFFKITQNPRTTLELFLNYDCNVSEQDIVVRVVDTLRKLAVGSSRLKKTAVSTLASIMITQAAWIEQYEEDDTRSDNSENPFQKNKQLKDHLKIAVSKFNIDPTSGLQYLADSGYLDKSSPSEIASFLKNSSDINKTVIGKFLGAEKNVQVLNEFLNLMDFAGNSLLSALRQFLSAFRIPGEGQIVDRIMEKFAEKYCQDNPAAFSSPDSAFLLSFGVMMLQTDLHNPSVKNKMPLNQFCLMFSQDSTLSKDLLSEIYEEVKQNPFTLAEDDEARLRQSNLGKNKDEQYAIESAIIYQKSQEVFRRAKDLNSPYYIAQDVEELKTLFTALWHPLLATFSIVLEETEDSSIWKLCINGLLACIKIACRFDLGLELEIFIGSLAKFTSLIYLHEQISEKNIDCMKALVEIANIEADYLKGSWVHILKCLSKLDYLHLIYRADSGRFTESELKSSENIAGHIIPSEIDCIFNASRTLDSNAIVDFVVTLVQISREELTGEHPQTFSLQALVHVADINMDRMRFVWGQVWHHLKNHFSVAGLHGDQAVASFAVDSLKQLAIKFLRKEELANFNFQKEFLSPFEVIMWQSKNYAVRELVVTCMMHLVLTMADNIRSGWISVYEILLIAVKEDKEPLIVPALQTFELIVARKLFGNIKELVTGIGELTRVSLDWASMRAVELLADCTENVKEKELWELLFSYLTKQLDKKRFDLMTKALSVAIQILKEHGMDFAEDLWKAIYDIVIPSLFKDYDDVCRDLIVCICDISIDRYESIGFAIRDVLEELALQGDVGINLIEFITCKIGHKFNEEVWRVYITVLRNMVAKEKDERGFLTLIETCKALSSLGIPRSCLEDLAECLCKVEFPHGKIEREGLSLLFETLFDLCIVELYEACRQIIKELHRTDLEETRKEYLIDIVANIIIPRAEQNAQEVFREIGKDLVSLVLISDLQVRNSLHGLLTKFLDIIYDNK